MKYLTFEMYVKFKAVCLKYQSKLQDKKNKQKFCSTEVNYLVFEIYIKFKIVWQKYHCHTKSTHVKDYFDRLSDKLISFRA